MSDNIFRLAVESTQQTSHGYLSGLQALGNNSTKISVSNPRLLNGSVDIDRCVKALYPEDNRWDYAIGYHNVAYFVEVHPAETSAVSTMIAKVTWLKQWLKTQAPLLDGIKSSQNTFQWVPSGRNAIAKNSREAFRLSKSGILITKGHF